MSTNDPFLDLLNTFDLQLPGSDNKKLISSKENKKTTANVIPQSNRWKGYWEQGFKRGEMDCVITISGSQITGYGSDLVGNFTWTGYISGRKVNIIKQYYGKHKVSYEGTMIDNSINGNWAIEHIDHGSFTLWRVG